MALPQAIQQQVDAAENLQQHLYAESQATESQPVSEPEVVSEPQSAQVIEMPKAAEQVRVEETPQPAPAPVVEEDASYWKQRFSTVQGKLNTEMPQLYQQLREQQQQIQTLIQQLNEKPATPEAKPEALVTQKDVDDFGEDLVDMVDRKATERVRREIAAAMAEFEKKFGAVQAQVGQVAERVIESESDKFWGRVTEIVPDWSAIDQDPRWVDWLDSTPDFSEDSYRVLAAKAIEKGNANKIAKLVETWKNTLPRQPDPNVLTRQQNELSRQVEPSTMKSSASTPVAERIWTAADYESAYDVRNVQRFGPAKASEMVAEADRAVAEGRVRW